MRSRKMRASGVDGVMLGRATLGNPWLVGQLRALDGRPRAGADSGGAASACVSPCTTTTRWSTSGARRARFRRCASTSATTSKASPARARLRERVMRTETAAETLRDSRSDDRRARSAAARARRRVERRGDDAGLLDEAYENYRAYLNPPLARVMKLSGSPVEVSRRRLRRSSIRPARSISISPAATACSRSGYRHPRVRGGGARAARAASRSRAARCSTRCWGGSAKRLAELTPGDLQISFFANSGAEAVEGALKLARAATQAHEVRRRRADAFHGKTLGRALGERARGVSRAVRTAAADVEHVPYGDARRAGARARRCGGVRSSSRCKARAASTFRRRAICATCARCATARARSSSPTKCRRASGRCGATLRLRSRRRRSRRDDAGQGTFGRGRSRSARTSRAPAVWNAAYAKGAAAAHLDLRRQPAGVRRGAGRARRALRRGSGRKRARARRAAAGRRAR